MKNRFFRILPSYYPFILVWLVMMMITGEVYGTEIIGNLTMMGWWCGGRNQFNWYTNAIWLFYLLAPFLVGIIGREDDGTVRPVNKSTIFEKSVNRKVVIIVCLMEAGFGLLYFCLMKLSGSMWNYGLWWYPFILIAPGLSLDLACLAEMISKFRIGRCIKNVVSQIGNASFEIFLWHIGVFEFVKPRYEMNGLKWAVLLTVVVLWSIGYRKGIECIVKKLKKIFSKNLKVNQKSSDIYYK